MPTIDWTVQFGKGLKCLNGLSLCPHSDSGPGPPGKSRLPNGLHGQTVHDSMVAWLTALWSLRVGARPWEIGDLETLSLKSDA